MIHDAGAHLHTIGSVEEACRAVDAGVDVIIAHGWEAGRPVRGEIGTPALVSVVNAGTRYRSSLQAVSPTLVTAPGQSGGVPGAECGGRDVVAGGAGGGHAVAEGAVAWTTSTLLILPDRIVGCGAGRQSQSFSSSLLAQISAVA